MKIGLVKYLNAKPYLSAFQNEDVLFDVPTRLNEQLIAGSLDIALTSSIVPLLHSLSYLPTFGIAAHKAIRSVNLYTKNEIPQRIFLTTESQTSIALLKILCKHYWKITPCFSNDPESDSYLLIGDDALTHVPPQGFKTIDLATAWFEFTGLPFVFALFSYKMGNFSALEKKLEKAISQFEMEKNIFQDYYSLCIYRLGEKEHQGLTLFKNYVHAS